MKFTNLTRATEIGATCYLLELANHKIILDSGMHPKHKGEAALPNFGLVPAGAIDAIFISHSHLDHIGSLPLLMRQQPQAKVFMTAPSVEIGSSLLHNSSNLMARSAEAIPNTALFSHQEIELNKTAWSDCNLSQPFDLNGDRVARNSEAHAQSSFEFYDAGHILGSAGILIRDQGKTLFYTGDVKFSDQTIARGAAFPQFEPGTLDVLVIETTRGLQPAAPDFTREKEELRFAHALDAALKNTDAAVLIPVFALGKTQEVLTMIYSFQQRGLLSVHTPIFIGGLSTKMTETYDRFSRFAPRHFAGLELLNTLTPNILRGQEAGRAEIHPGCIYALSSGMMTEHTLSYVFAKRMLENPKHSIFFVGYSDPETLAGKLKVSKPGDWIEVPAGHEESAQPTQKLQVRCQIEQFDFSAHATRETIFSYIEKTSPKKVVLVHGDPGAVEWFERELKQKCAQIEVIIPMPGVPIELGN